MKMILQAVAAHIAHDIIETKIFKAGEERFMAVKLNVNWHDPCDFYRYDAESGRLRLLESWEDVDVIGVALP